MQRIRLHNGINILQAIYSVILPLQMKLVGEITLKNIGGQYNQAIHKWKLWFIYSFSNLKLSYQQQSVLEQCS